jgi:hypothetical protein
MSLLPGVRELRAPLTAGMLWLFAGYIGIAPLLPSDLSKVDQPLSKDVILLAGRLESGVVLAALAFIAYLIGMLSSALTRVVISSAQ